MPDLGQIQEEIDKSIPWPASWNQERRLMAPWKYDDCANLERQAPGLILELGSVDGLAPRAVLV